MSKPKILIQLDTDPHASVFDAVVAVDSGVDHLFQYNAVEPTEVRDLIHGAIFTRGVKDLANTAVFVGGSNVAAGESILQQVRNSFVGPMRVSVLLDADGANTTAAAAVLIAARYVDLTSAATAVLGATGPVGQRAVRLLARAGASVRAASRSLERAQATCQSVLAAVPQARVSALVANTSEQLLQVVDGVQVVIAAGAAGVELISPATWAGMKGQVVAIDLNAVPPAGITGIDPMDNGVLRRGVACYGAIGVGGLKMKIHKAALRALFEANDRVLDAEQVFEIGRAL
ncbi:MAG: bifunctional NADP-dependent methylenetetrahydromethanopterin dehydrogenase/methylenetetrahydrofolate dehydrogenase [Planctomycetes bacterium]|nr:bifunctional NADP-dependent methylenetetrahydromethanopterin dehydrogenase/methylenetetrahydrofolate dehydrogenase [Planctomycetota bacterium]